MVIKIGNILLTGLACMIGTNVLAVDKFDMIKSKLDSAKIVQLDLIIAVNSKVFDEIDTTYGKIYFSDDGCYIANLDDDIYLYDGTYNWEYSAENNQATKQKLGQNEQTDNRLSFFKNINKYYKSEILQSDKKYRLIKLNDADEALPDSLIIFLNKTGSSISRLEYFDLNGDLNKIIITDEKYSDQPDSDLFKINLPDSVEIIDLP